MCVGIIQLLRAWLEQKWCLHKPNPSQFWSLGSQRTKHQIRCLVRACFFIESCLLTVPSCCRRARELYGAFFIRALIPILRAAYSPSPKASPPNNITLGIRVSTYEFVGEWEKHSDYSTHFYSLWIKLKILSKNTLICWDPSWI